MMIENAPRTPDHPELCEAVIWASLPQEEEYFRRANHDESKVPSYTLPPIPDSLDQWEAQKA